MHQTEISKSPYSHKCNKVGQYKVVGIFAEFLDEV